MRPFLYNPRIWGDLNIVSECISDSIYIVRDRLIEMRELVADSLKIQR